MKETNAVTKPVSPSPEETSPVDKAREQLIEEVADDARSDPQRWLRDAEVPKGGE